MRTHPFIWFPGEIRIQKHDGRWWPMSCIADAEQDLPAWAGLPSLTISGPGAVWMYAYLGHRAGRAGVPELVVRRPDREARITAAMTTAIRAEDAAGPAGIDDCLRRDASSKTLLVELSDQPYGMAHDRELRALAAAIRPSDEVVLTGRGAVETYAFLGYTAGLFGASRVSCILPPEGMAVVNVHGERLGYATPLSPWLATQVRRGSGDTYGIVGVPNSGKSVLAKLLGDSLRGDVRSGLPPVSAWTFDADPASPTPDWYLDLVGRGLGDSAKFVRDAHKVEWSDKLQSEIAERLESSRGFFDRVVVDLPGGDTRDPARPDLIPRGRERLFQLVDRFIILDRPELGGAERWINALDRHGLRTRVHAVLESRHPSGSLNLRLEHGGERVGGFVEGLDRKAVVSLSRGDRMSDSVVRDLRQLVGVA